MKVYNSGDKKVIVLTNDSPPQCPVLLASGHSKAILRDDFEGEVSTHKSLLNKLVSL